jgi:hypothetical protein
MPRIWLAVLVSTAVVVSPTSAVASGHHAKPKHHAKPGAIKTGTYKATPLATGLTTASGAPVEHFNIALKSTKCTSAPGQGSPALHLCVAVPNAPYIVLTAPTTLERSLSSFATPVALPSSDTLTEHVPTTAETVAGEPPGTGQNTFSVTFTKKGTASGYFEATMTGLRFGRESISETPVKVPFTAKLG